MKIDIYTKVVLTVIAVCLIWLCIMNTIPPVQANPDTVDVRIVGVTGNIPVKVQNIGLLEAVPITVEHR